MEESRADRHQPGHLGNGDSFRGHHAHGRLVLQLCAEGAFPILVAIGNLVDPPATMINSSGDYVASFIVSRFVDGKNWLEKAMAKE